VLLWKNIFLSIFELYCLQTEIFCYAAKIRLLKSVAVILKSRYAKENPCFVPKKWQLFLNPWEQFISYDPSHISVFMEVDAKCL